MLQLVMVGALLGASFDSLKAACESGELSACLEQGRAYATGDDVDRDDQKAYSLFQLTCQKGSADGCMEQGAAMQSGLGTAKDEPHGAQLLEKACDKGSARGCGELGASLLVGRGLPKDLERGQLLLSRTCAKNVPSACIRLATWLADEAPPGARDVPRAGRLLSEACASGDPKSCAHACELRAEGVAMPRSEIEALGDCERACEKKERVGCYYVGFLQVHGAGTPSTVKKGLDALSTACVQSEPRSCIALAELYEQGAAGLKKSLPRARDLFESATLRLATLCGKNGPAECALNAELAVQGRVKASGSMKPRGVLENGCTATATLGCWGLGLAYATGFDGEKDLTRAAAAWKVGCDHGRMRACRSLGQALLKGAGVEANEADGKALLDKACAGWDGEACLAMSEFAGGKKTKEGKALRALACRHGAGGGCR